MKLPKLLIIGETGHGKDELCKILADHFGYRFASASMIACELVVFEKLKEKYDYATIEDCHADRRNHISDWVDIIAEYNAEDGAALARQVMQVSDIYCGVRKRSEFNAMLEAKLFDCIIYIDATKRLGKPEQAYVELTAEDAHFTIDNNADIKQLIQKAKRAHARAMQMASEQKSVYDGNGTEVVTRDNLVKTTEEEKQQIINDINEQHKVAEGQSSTAVDDQNLSSKVEEQAQTVNEIATEVVEKTTETLAEPSRPPKAPIRKTTRKTTRKTKPRSK